MFRGQFSYYTNLFHHSDVLCICFRQKNTHQVPGSQFVVGNLIALYCPRVHILATIALGILESGENRLEREFLHLISPSQGNNFCRAVYYPVFRIEILYIQMQGYHITFHVNGT